MGPRSQNFLHFNPALVDIYFETNVMAEVLQELSKSLPICFSYSKRGCGEILEIFTISAMKKVQIVHES